MEGKKIEIKQGNKLEATVCLDEQHNVVAVNEDGSIFESFIRSINPGKGFANPGTDCIVRLIRWLNPEIIYFPMRLQNILTQYFPVTKQ